MKAPLLNCYTILIKRVFLTSSAVLLVLSTMSAQTPKTQDKNTIGYYIACGHVSSSDIYYKENLSNCHRYLQNLRSLNINWRTFFSVFDDFENGNVSQFIPEDSLRSIQLVLAKKFKQLKNATFLENLSPDENEPLVNIKGTKTFTLIENLIDSLILPVYDRPVYYCTQQYRPSSSEFNSITEILIDKLKFLASVAPAQFRSSYLAQIKALETPIAIDQTLPTLTKEEEVKLIELRRLISINGDHWGVAMLDPQMLHLLAKEQGQDIPFKICKYYIDALIKMYSIGTNSRQLSNLNTKVTKMLNGEIPIMRLVQS